MPTQLTDQQLLNLTQEEATRLVESDRELAVWALLKLSALAKGKGAGPGLSTPSSQIPPYEKPSADKTARGKKKRGRKKGHQGARRKPPIAIDRREEHTLARCPECDGPVGAPRGGRRRVVEDIEQTRVVATEHTIRSHWCPRCKKRVEPRVVDALPKSTIGNRALVLSSWLHYGLGQTTSQIVSVFDSLFHFPVSGGGLAQQWQRVAGILAPWYQSLADQARASAVLNADETGWRVNGKTHWLWCFTEPTLTYYVIDRSRGSKVVNEFLGEAFEGTLVTDFFAAYNHAVADEKRQRCLTHLLREIKKVSNENTSDEWRAFAKRLKRIVSDALRLSATADRESPDYPRKVNRIHRRVDELAARSEWGDADCRRLAKRLDRHRLGLLIFLDDPAVPADNNRAEREIRPAVIARKNSFQNVSDNGAQTQAALMSIYRTLKLRGHDPLETIADALAVFIATGTLPQLPRPPD